MPEEPHYNWIRFRGSPQLGTLHGAVSPEHFDTYLEEYAFRFNRRTAAHRGLLFYRVLEQAVQTVPAPYHSLVGGKLRRAAAGAGSVEGAPDAA